MGLTNPFWSPAPDTPILRSDCVHVWRFHLDPCDARIGSLDQILSADEHQRANRLAFKEKRDQFVVARSVLRVVLAKYLDVEPSKLVFSYGEHGKPSIEGQPNGIEFSLSHSELIGLIGVARNRRIGIDVDQLGRVTDWIEVAKKNYSNNEQEQLFSLRHAERESAFIRAWTRKEAYTKALGNGFAYGFRNFSVSLTGQARLIDDDIHPDWPSAWQLAEVKLELPNIGSIAVENKGSQKSHLMIEGFNFQFDIPSSNAGAY